MKNIVRVSKNILKKRLVLLGWSIINFVLLYWMTDGRFLVNCTDRRYILMCYWLLYAFLIMSGLYWFVSVKRGFKNISTNILQFSLFLLIFFSLQSSIGMFQSDDIPQTTLNKIYIEIFVSLLIIYAYTPVINLILSFVSCKFEEKYATYKLSLVVFCILILALLLGLNLLNI